MKKISILLPLAAVVALAQTRLQTPTRISDSASLPATLNTKVTEWRDINNSTLFWDARAEVSTVSPGTRLWYLRDNAGAKVLELRRTFAGGVVDLAILDMHLEPTADNVRRIGGPLKRWSSVEAGDVMLQNLKPPTFGAGSITFTGDLLPSGTRAIGASAQRLTKLWLVDLDISGTCTGPGCGGGGFWTRNSGAGELEPATVSDSVRFRRWEMPDITGESASWDIFNNSTAASPGTRTLSIRDPNGLDVLKFERSFGGVTTKFAYLDMNWIPAVDASYDHGHPSYRWRDGRYSRDLFVGGAASITGGVTVGSLNITSGTCTGCPNYWQLTGFSPVTLSPLSTAYNLALGSTSAPTHKLEVTGSASISGNLHIGFGANLWWTSDGGGSIGTTTGSRPSGIYAATEVRTFNGAGSSITRVLLSGSGVVVYDSGGSQVASISGTTGRVASNAGFTVAGVNGVSGTSAGGCVVSGGLLTNMSCLP